LNVLVKYLGGNNIKRGDWRSTWKEKKGKSGGAGQGEINTAYPSYKAQPRPQEGANQGKQTNTKGREEK